MSPKAPAKEPDLVALTLEQLKTPYNEGNNATSNEFTIKDLLRTGMISQEVAGDVRKVLAGDRDDLRRQAERAHTQKTQERDAQQEQAEIGEFDTHLESGDYDAMVEMMIRDRHDLGLRAPAVTKIVDTFIAAKRVDLLAECMGCMYAGGKGESIKQKAAEFIMRHGDKETLARATVTAGFNSDEELYLAQAFLRKNPTVSEVLEVIFGIRRNDRSTNVLRRSILANERGISAFVQCFKVLAVDSRLRLVMLDLAFEQGVKVFYRLLEECDDVDPEVLKDKQGGPTGVMCANGLFPAMRMKKSMIALAADGGGAS